VLKKCVCIEGFVRDPTTNLCVQGNLTLYSCYARIK
jgi:hypothetical protein